LELKLIETVLVQEKLGREMQWLESYVANAPESLKEDLQALLDSRKAAYDAIGSVIESAVLTIPAEVQSMAIRYVPEPVEPVGEVVT
jgi:chorismate synthase